MLQTEIGNVHIAALTNLRTGAPDEVFYVLLIHEEGRLSRNFVAPYRVQFYIGKGGTIVGIRILDSVVNRFAQDIGRLADEYNQEQVALLESLLSSGSSVDESGRQRIGEAVTASREIASTPPRVIPFEEQPIAPIVSPSPPMPSPPAPVAPPPAPASVAPPPAAVTPPAPPAPAASPADSIASRETRILPAQGQATAAQAPAAPARDSGPPPVEQMSVVPPSAPAPAPTSRSGPAIGVGPTPEQARASTPPSASADPYVRETARVRIAATQLAQSLRSARNPRELLNAWQNIQTAYLNLVNNLDNLIKAESMMELVSQLNGKAADDFTRLQRMIEPGSFDDNARAKILSYANITDMFAGIVFSAAWDASAPFSKKPKFSEQAFLLTQMRMIADVRERVKDIVKSIHPDGTGTSAQISNDITSLRSEIDIYINPILWTDKFLTTIRSYRKFDRRLSEVFVSMKGDVSMIQFGNPQQYINLISRFLLYASKFHWKQVRLNFEWNQQRSSSDTQGTLIIGSESLSLSGVRRQDGVREIVRQMDGRWDIPWFLGRHFRKRLQKVRNIFGPPFDRVMIPIAAAANRGATPASRPVQTPPPGGPSGGTGGSSVAGLADFERAETVEVSSLDDPSRALYTYYSLLIQAQSHTGSGTIYGNQFINWWRGARAFVGGYHFTPVDSGAVFQGAL